MLRLICLLSFRAVWASPWELLTGGSCVWVDGLGCEMSYHAECDAYHTLRDVDLRKLNALDSFYYETRCNYCSNITDQQKCLSSDMCTWTAGACSFPKHIVASMSLEDCELPPKGVQSASFIQHEITVHKACRDIGNEKLCRENNACLWNHGKVSCDSENVVFHVVDFFSVFSRYMAGYEIVLPMA